MAKDVVDVKVEGFEKALAKLDGLPGKLQRKFLRRGMNQGSKPMFDAAKRNVPKRTGKLRKGIVRKIITKKAAPEVRIGTTREASHWHLVEFGTGPRVTKKGASRGAMPARPFFRPAFDTFLSTFDRKVREEIERGIEEASRG